MKKLTTILALNLFFVFYSYSQSSWGPDAFGYIAKSSMNTDADAPVFKWIDITNLSGAVPVKLLGDDNVRGSFQIGFPFHYYWYDVDTFYVDANGALLFQHGQLSSGFQSIPSDTLPNDYIAAYECDLTFADGANNPGKCYYWVNAALDTLIVSWDSVPFYTEPDTFSGINSFQIILSTVDSSITIQLDSTFGYPVSGSPNWIVSGIKSKIGSVGLEIFKDSTITQGDYFPNRFAIKYYYPRHSAFSISDAAIAFNNNPTTGAIFLMTGDVFDMTATVQNIGNTNLNPFLISGKIIGPLNDTTVLVQDSTSTTGILIPQQSQTITMENTFMPSDTGEYEFISSTNQTGNASPPNRSKTLEMHVFDNSNTSFKLSYDHGVSQGTLSWVGYTGGAGNYFVPPFYPCYLTEVSFYTGNSTGHINPGDAFYTEVFDDKGFQGSPGNRLDSVYVPLTTSAGWITVPLTQPITINSGGFYVGWVMNAPHLIIGLDNTAPFSNRSFEVLGGEWEIFRMREGNDLLINATIQKSLGIHEYTNGFSSEVFPNPASDKVSIKYNLSESTDHISISLFNMQGQQLSMETIHNVSAGENIYNINLKGIPDGMYLSKMQSDRGVSVNKITLIRN